MPAYFNQICSAVLGFSHDVFHLFLRDDTKSSLEPFTLWPYHGAKCVLLFFLGDH